MSSLKVSIEAMIISCVADTIENRYVVVSTTYHTCQHGLQCTHATGRHNLGDVHKIRPNNIQKTRIVQQAGQTNNICMAQKVLYGTLQAATFLGTAIGNTTGVGIHSQPI